MENNLAALVEALPKGTLYVHVRSPYYNILKQYPWFGPECEYHPTWDTDFQINAYLVPFERILELYAQGDPELFLFTSFG